MESGKFKTNKWLGGNVGESNNQWNVVKYYYPFNTPPIVFTQIQDFYIHKISQTRFEFRCTYISNTSPEPQGSNPSPSTTVTISWLAVERHLIPGFLETGIKENIDEVILR